MNSIIDNRGERTTASQPPLSQQFSQFAHATSVWTGNSVAFLLAVAVIIVWVVSGPFFNFSDTWQLVINTGTTIVTFLMVFLIQNTQNRDTLAIQLKLSELVLAMKGAENKYAATEDLSDEELQALHDDCRARAEMTLNQLEGRRKATAPRMAIARVLRCTTRRRRGRLHNFYIYWNHHSVTFVRRCGLTVFSTERPHTGVSIRVG